MSYLILDVESTLCRDRMYDTNREIVGWSEIGDPQYEDRAQCLERVEKPFEDKVPVRYHRPVLVSMLLVDDWFRLVGCRTHHSHCPPEVVRRTWDSIGQAITQLGVQHIVTFGGKQFDLPVLEMEALSLQLKIPFWFMGFDTKAWDNPRSKSDINKWHIDMQQILAGSGVYGGTLGFWSRLAGLPGKIDVSGQQVAEMAKHDRWEQLTDYCLCDCLNTLGLLANYLHAAGIGPKNGSRSAEFEAIIGSVLAERKAAGAGQEIERYWRLFGAEVPF